MKCYPNDQGGYDCYDIEPVVISAEEHAELITKNNLVDRKKELLAELAEIDGILGIEKPNEFKPIDIQAVYAQEPEITTDAPQSILPDQGTTAVPQTYFKKKW